MKISSSILDRFGNPIEYNKPNYKLPEALGQNGVVQTKLATDSKAFDNDLPINSMGFDGYYNIDNLVQTFCGWGVLSQVAQNGIVQAIIQTISNASTQKWGKLVYNGDKKNIEKKLKIIESRFRKLKLREFCRIAHQKTILFGGCMGYAHIQGDQTELEKELILNKRTITHNSVRYLKVIEPLYAVPTSFNGSNPLSKYFYAPEDWNVCGHPIHISRMTHFTSNDAPILLKPVYQFFGISVIQLLLDYLNVFENMRDDIANIVNKYNINVLKSDLSAILGGNPSDQDITDVKTRVALFNKMRTNFGTLMLDRESEEWQQFNMALSGLDKLVQQNLEYIPAICRIPATKLFGQSPTGFGSSGEHELKTFYDLIQTEQTSVLLPHIETYLDMIQLDEFGEIDPDITFEFNPLAQTSDLEKSQIFTGYTTSLTGMVTGGLISPEEARTWLAGQESLEFNELDTSVNITDLYDDESAGNEGELD